MNPALVSRRTFLKSSAAAASLFTLPRFAIGQEGPPPSKKVNLAFIGIGGIGGSALSGCNGENYVAFHDLLMM